MKRLFLPLVLIVPLAACAPMRDGPPAATALSATELALQAQPAMQWPSQRWWERYDDAQLNGLIDKALTGSPDMAIAETRLRQAQAAAAGAEAPLWPSLNANYQQTRQRYSANYIYPEPLGGSVGSDARLALDASYELDLWHKNRSALQAAQSRTEAAQAETQWARNVLVLAIVQSYADLQNAYAQRDVLRRSLKRADDVLKLTRERFQAGLDTQVEVKQAEAMRADTEVQSTQVAADIARLNNQLAALSGVSPTAAKPLDAIALQLPQGLLPAQAPLDLLGRRPDIVAARWQAQAAGAEVDVAKKRFYPNVNLTAFAGFMTLSTGLLFNHASRMAGISPAISLPLFEGGRLNAELDGARARRDEAVAHYNQAVLAGVREVTDALDGLRLLTVEAGHQHTARQATQAAYDLALQRYRAGLGNYLSVLTAQSGVLEQERRDTALAARAYRLDAALATALGGGYEAAATTSADAGAGADTAADAVPQQGG